MKQSAKGLTNLERKAVAWQAKPCNFRSRRLEPLPCEVNSQVTNLIREMLLGTESLH